MAKFLLWAYVIINGYAYGQAYSNGSEPHIAGFFSIWAVIGIIAICDAIKKSKGDD